MTDTALAPAPLVGGKTPNGVAFTIKHPARASDWTTFCVYRDDVTGLVRLVRRDRRSATVAPSAQSYAWTASQNGTKGRAAQMATLIESRLTGGAHQFTGPHPVWCGETPTDSAASALHELIVDGPVAVGKSGDHQLDAPVLRRHKIADAQAFADALEPLVGTDDVATLMAAVTKLTPAPFAIAPDKVERTERDKVEEFHRPNGERYWPRIIDGTISDVAMLRKARADGMPVVFYGPPGTGKTALVEAAFPDVVSLDGTGDTEVADFVGGYVPDPDIPGKYLWEDAGLPTAMLKGVPYFVDEISRINPQVLTIIYPLMDGRDRITVPGRPAAVGGRQVHAAPGFYIVAAFNPDIPGCRIDEPLASRFAIHVEFSTDYTLALKLNCPPNVVKVARKLDVMRRDPTHALAWAPQLRELIRFRDQAAKFSEMFAWRALLGATPMEDRDVVGQTIEEQVGVKSLERLSTNGAA